MIDLKDREIAFAVDAVRKACELARQIQQEMTAAELTKGDKSPVTVADFAVQALIGKFMLATFPEDSVVAEEEAKALRSDENQNVRKQVIEFVKRFEPSVTEESLYQWIDVGNAKPKGRFWTLDPIDGTKGFLRGDQYAVALALVEDGKVQVGILGCPNLNAKNEKEVGGAGSLFIAKRGSGSWRSVLFGEALDLFEQIHVSNHKTPEEAYVLRSVVAAHTNAGRTEKYLKHLGITREPRYMDSQAKHAVLASGYGDIFFYFLPTQNPNFRMKIWDVTAGALVVEEAGGRVSDLEGGEIDFTQGDTVAKNPGLLYTNGHIHEAALAALKSLS